MKLESLENQFEDCFDKNTFATGGGYEADTTHKWDLWRSLKPHIIEAIKQQSLLFAEWCDTKAVRNGFHEWMIGNGSYKQHYTTEQLYDLFLEEQQTLTS